MAAKRPRFTENFSRNLSAIEEFLAPDSQTAFGRLMDRLFDDIVPTICRFPLAGRSFLSREVRSLKGQIRIKDLRKLLPKEADLREFIMDDYLVLYLIRRNQVTFLAIQHHRQVSFDLKQFWCEE